MADEDSRAGVRYAERGLLDFVDGLHAPHDEGLQRAYAAPGERDMPAIQIGPAEGKTLALLLSLIGAERVVEVGTLAGYSAIWMARALPAGGRLWTIEYEPRHAEVARENLRAAGVDDRVEVLAGAALEVLPGLVPQGPFDAVFVDADKGHYPQYGEWAADNLRPGGLLLADNAYFFGKLLGEQADAEAMRRFHRATLDAFDSVCVPTPDGLVVARRK